MGIQIAAVTMRLIFLINLVLGILFWTGHADPLVIVHMLLGIVFVALLFFAGTLQAMAGGPIGLMGGTFAVGLLLAIIGFVQDDTGWLKIVHVLVALAAIGLAEMSFGRYRRLSAARAAK
ncbi:MAG TPA: hypothetical protein VGS80_11660 [Ktedonobacterales bacterium]|nr:hypothetical protein [Ktedonobacterales bacterium]